MNPIVILPPRITDDSKAIWKACVDLGWPTHRVQGWRVSFTVPVAQEVIIYGEPLFAEAVADQLGLVLLEPSIEWLTTVPREYLSRSVELMTLGDARKLVEPAFVKPADGKIFDPRVYDCGAELPTEANVDLATPVLRSEIVDFRLEVRCFVKERTISTLSPYWRNGQLADGPDGDWSFLCSEEDEAKAFASLVMADPRVALPPSCALDVGRLANGSWAIIEANPCWGAGLYGCDPKSVLETVRVAVIRRDHVSAESNQWISKRKGFIA